MIKKISCIILALLISNCYGSIQHTNLHHSKDHNHFENTSLLFSSGPCGAQPPQNGGTGACNASTSIITLGGTLQTAANLTFAGAYNSTLNFATASNITFPSGTYTLAEIAGSNATGTWPISITGTAATVTTIPNLTGDITSVGNATTISNNIVTYAKLQQVAASSLVGNATGSLANATEITLGSTLAFSGSALQTTAISGDVTTSANSFATTLATVNSTTGSFGSATQVGTFTVNSKGLITAAGNTTISGVAPGGTAGGDLSGTYPNPATAKINGVALGSTTATSGNLLIGSGTAWVTNPVSGNVTISSTGVTTIGAVQVTNAMLAGSIDLTSKVTNNLPFANGGFGFNTATTGDIFYASATNTPAKLSDVALGQVIISGGVGAVPTYSASPTLTGLTLNGLTISQLTGTNGSDVLVSGNLTGDVTTSAFVSTIANNVVTYAKLQQVAAASLVGNATGSTANATGITLGSTLAFSGSALQTAAISGDVTTSANSFATTLATVNSTSGNYGDATHASTITVNAKGLVTASSNTLISGVAPGGTAGGDLSGTYPNPAVAKINGVPVTSSTISDGQVLIGSTSGSNFTAATLTGTTNEITVTNASHSITLSTPQAIGTSSSPQFTGLTLTGLSVRSVLYAASSGAINQDNPNFVYDGAGHNLFLGSNNISPTAVGRLNILGTDSTVGASEVFFTSADSYPLIQLLPFAHDNVSINFDSYYSGGWKSSSANSSFQIDKTSSAVQINYAVAAQGGTITWATALAISSAGAVNLSQLTASSLLSLDGSKNIIATNTLSTTVLGNIPVPTITTFTGGASGNYTPPAGCTHIVVEGWASGGGGGGVAGAASSAGAAGGGGSGGHFSSLLVAPFGGAPFAYSVGSGGAGGVAGANNGTNGASTTFGSFVAGAGLGGTASTSGVTIAIAAGGNINAGSGSPDILTSGMGGLAGLVLSSTVASAGYGGNSPAGGSGGRASLNGTGSAGAIPGGGGAGGAGTNATNRAGGAGADGKIVIYEYYNG